MPQPIARHRPAGRDAAAAYRAQKHRKARNAFYSSANWRRLRAAHLAEHPLCAECERHERSTPASHVHHRRPVETHWPNRFDRGNLESLCPSCHNAQEIR